VPRKRILLVRHGKTEWNGFSRFQGKSDVPLDDEGKCQAELLAARLAGWEPAAVFSSTLSRARETAEVLVSRNPGVSPLLRENLAESGFGTWEGRSIHEIESADPESFRRWMDSPFENPPPGGESFASVEFRVRSALDEILSTDGERIVVVSHGGILRAMLVLLLDLPLRTVWRMKIANCSLTGIDVGKRGASLAFLNDDLHTRMSGEGTEIPLLPV
jgi:alpha-ribazole phosphatase/probable phosphoglycerate mutase